MQIVKGVGIVIVSAMLVVGCREQRETPIPKNAPETPLEKGVEMFTGGGEKPPKEPANPPAGEDGDEPEVPEIPVAAPVPDKPGFVISPYNGKWIDVTGVKPGTLMADPHFTEEKKFFRVPEIPVQPEAAPEESEQLPEQDPPLKPGGAEG